MMIFRVLVALMLVLSPCSGCRVNGDTSGLKELPRHPHIVEPWRDVDIGSPAKVGSHTSTADSLLVVGAGTGDSKGGNDQLHYTYFTQATNGDVDVSARLTSFTGPDHARAGIMLRAGNDKDSSTAAILVALKDEVDGKDNIFTDAHDEPSNSGHYYGVSTRMPLPIWIRLVRIGQDFAVYKSPDGHFWSALGNESGWQFAATGPVEVGFFVASGNSNTTASATFDKIRTGSPSMGYESSWFGNTFGGRVYDGHASLSISALWTAPDGSCYTNSGWDEAGKGSNLYKDGRVVTAYANNNWMLGSNRCAEGSITSDGRNLYLLGYGHEGTVLLKTDMLAKTRNTVPMPLSIDPLGVAGREHINIISGLAASKNELYISDSRANLIRVARTSIPIYETDINSTVNITTHTIDTNGVAYAAPDVVYQSQRTNDSLSYTVPGLRPSDAYTVRCHFAEYKETEQGRRLIDVYVSGARPVMAYDVVAKAGGPFKAAVLDIPGGHADSVGKLHLTLVRSTGGDGQAVINGFEVRDSDGKRAFALNCGGPEVGGFQTETYDLPQRSFPFQHPGPIAVDKRGDLWIIQEANDFPVGTSVATKYRGAVLCYHPNGTYAGRRISDVANPTAIAYDPVRDRLLIADNGPKQNIRFYDRLTLAPTFAGEFGTPGGIFATAGPASRTSDSGSVRLYGLTGVGIDANENIYVACGMQGTDLREYAEGGKLLWAVDGLQYCNTPGLDPDSDGTIAYSTYYRAALDYTKTTPGSEWSFLGYAWNPIKYGDPPRQVAAQAIVRRVGASRSLIVYTSGQGAIDYIGIFRFNGSTIIPCGQIRKSGALIWIDKNGDGVETPDEVEKLASPGYMTQFSVDQHGDIWLALLGRQNAIIRHLRFQGLNAAGCPIYDLKPGDYEDIPYPRDQHLMSTQGQLAEVIYDSDRDSMYLVGPAERLNDYHHDVLCYLARYDNWRFGNRTPRWMVSLPDPATDPNFPYETADPYGLGYRWMGLDVAVDKLFIAGMWGNINAYDTADGTLWRIISPGPEIDGHIGWEDAAMGLTACKRKDGQYVVITENGAFDGKSNLYRIDGDEKLTKSVH